MSQQLSDVAKIEFDKLVKHAYQGKSKLVPCVTPRNNIVAGSYNARKMGKGTAQLDKGISEDLTPMNVDHDLIPIPLKNAVAGDYTDIFSQAEVNFDEKNELAITIAAAIGRAEDQMIINSLKSTNFHADAGTALTAIDEDVGGANTNMNVEKLLAAKATLEEKGVVFPDDMEGGVGQGDSGQMHDMVTCVMHTNQKWGLLRETKVTSADYASVKALVNGQIGSFLGIRFKFIETRSEGGVEIAANERKCFMFARSSVLGVRGVLPRMSSIDWIPEKTSWLTSGYLKYAAGVRDANGIVQINCYEA